MSNNDSTTGNNNLHQVDDQIYYFDIWLYNQLDGQDPFQVPYVFVDAISIEETLIDWNTKGWIIINNEQEILEKYFPNTLKAPLIFRTDGRNRLRIQIYPVFDKLAEDPKSAESMELRKKWEICLDCVIYDVEDLDVPNAVNKKRKLYFHSELYQNFTEKNIEWSTAVEGRKLQGLPKIVNPADIDRTCKANIALKSLILEAVKNPNTNDTMKIGWVGGELMKDASKGGSMSEPNKPVIVGESNTDTGTVESDKQWYAGTVDNSIFYTSPAYSNVIDDIKYLLQYCGTREEGPCFLEMSRSLVDLVTVKLKTFKSYLDEVKRNEQVEHLLIEDGVLNKGDISTYSKDTTQKPYWPKAPNSDSSPLQNFTSGRASIIKAYKFSPMVALDDSRLCTTPLHQFDFSTGQFKITFQDNKIDDVHNTLTNYAQGGLYAFAAKNNDAHVLLNINQTKKTGMMIHNDFTPLQYVPKFLPQTNMIRDSIFLNESITFLVAGLTIRAPGRFIFIDKLSSNAIPDPFDDRFLGQWMITKVVHLFQQGKYVSEVVATKIDTFRKLWDKEDKKY